VGGHLVRHLDDVEAPLRGVGQHEVAGTSRGLRGVSKVEQADARDRAALHRPVLRHLPVAVPPAACEEDAGKARIEVRVRILDPEVLHHHDPVEIRLQALQIDAQRLVLDEPLPKIVEAEGRDHQHRLLQPQGRRTGSR